MIDLAAARRSKRARSKATRHAEKARGGRWSIARAYLVLATDIPHGERNVLVLDGLDVETCGRSRTGRRGRGQSSAPVRPRRRFETCDERRGKFGRRISSASLDAGDGSSCGGDLPMVGMVVTISPSLSLYRMVVLPAASRPTWVDERKRRTGFQRSHARERIPNFCRPPLESGRKTLPARTIRMRISFLEKSLLKSLVNVSPMVENSRVGARARRR